jgi:hypothetical protein
VPHFELARDLADRFAVIDGEIVMAGEQSQMDEAHFRRHFTCDPCI